MTTSAQRTPTTSRRTGKRSRRSGSGSTWGQVFFGIYTSSFSKTEETVHSRRAAACSNQEAVHVRKPRRLGEPGLRAHLEARCTHHSGDRPRPHWRRDEIGPIFVNLFSNQNSIDHDALLRHIRRFAIAQLAHQRPPPASLLSLLTTPSALLS